MTPSVRFTTFPAKKFLRVEMAGFFTLAAVADYAEQRRSAFGKLGCGPGEHTTLCDVRGCQVSTQDVLAAFAIALNDPATGARRIAFLTESGLMRQQVRRMVHGDRARCFTAESDALAWLSGGDTGSTPTTAT